jgi:hypothetical protein
MSYSKSYFSKGGRDKNEPLILEVIRRYNIQYRQGSDSDGYDVLLMTSPMMLIEIKNPAMPQSGRQLTAKEIETRDYCELVGIPYHVVLQPEEMVEIIGTYLKNTLIRGD